MTIEDKPVNIMASNQTTGISVNLSTGEVNAGTVQFRNRIINGDMRIAQRGASILGTPNAKTYKIDSWYDWNSYTTYNVTFSQETDAPSRFQNSLKITTTGLSGGTYLLSGQAIEGFNISDMSWGTSSATSATLSFWVKQSKVGAFTLLIENGTEALLYHTSYTIQVAGSWEYKSIVIPGPTTGTWNNGNGVGVFVHLISQSLSGYSSATFSSNWRTRAQLGGAWAAQLVGTSLSLQTSGDYVMFTGVQLEKGTIATPFEFRPYALELQLCQRYFQYLTNWNGLVDASTSIGINAQFIVTMRDTPTPAKNGSAQLNYRSANADNTTTGWNLNAPVATTNSIWFQANLITGATLPAIGYPVHYRHGIATPILTLSAEL